MNNQNDYEEKEDLIIQDQPEEVEEVQPDDTPIEPEERSPQQSWKELRKKAELADKLQDERNKLEKERNEYLELLKKIDQENKSKQQYAQEPEDDFDIDSLDEDEIITVKDLKRARLQEAKKLKKLEDDYRHSQRVSHDNAIEAELSKKNNDFYQVLTIDNINKLREMRPGLARSLNLNPDLKEKAEETYQAIKDLGIFKAPTQDQQIAQKNSAKPRSMNSISPQAGNSPLSQANAFAGGLTQELKNKLYQEMLDKSRG